MLALAVRTEVGLDVPARMIQGFATFYGGVGEALGAYGRGVVRVLGPDTAPLLPGPGPHEHREE
jgi:hypothetical protein